MFGEHSAIEDGPRGRRVDIDGDRPPAHVASETTSRGRRPQAPTVGIKRLQGTRQTPLIIGEFFGVKLS